MSGAFARSVADLACIYDVMQGEDPADPVCAARGIEPVLPHLHEGVGDLRIAVAGDYFRRGGNPEAYAAVDRLAAALAVRREVMLPEAGRARAAAYLISAAEGASLHLARLRERAADFDPAVRDRLLAGAMIPAGAVVKAQKFRAWFQARVREIFAEVDVILAPGNALPRAFVRAKDDASRRQGSAGARRSRHLYAADFLHRPAGLHRARVDARRAPADRRAIDRSRMARGFRAARGAGARKHGARVGARRRGARHRSEESSENQKRLF